MNKRKILKFNIKFFETMKKDKIIELNTKLFDELTEFFNTNKKTRVDINEFIDWFFRKNSEFEKFVTKEELVDIIIGRRKIETGENHENISLFVEN